MNFSINKYDNYSTIKIEEEKVDTAIAPELKSEFMTLSQEGVKSIIIDMGDVKYMDSSGLSALLVGNRSFNETGAFVMFKVTDHVMKLITISQLDKVLTILPTKEEAVDYVFMTEIEKDRGIEE